MKIAVISNGPSAVLFDKAERNGYDRVLAVNEAATLWRSKWWVATDWLQIERNIRNVLGAPFLFTRKSTPQLLRENSKDSQAIATLEEWMWEGRIVAHETITNPMLPATVPPWNCYSGTAALILAWWLNADQIDIYGVDLAGETDSTGKPWHTRKHTRWTHETCIVDAIVGMYAERGIVARRITDGDRDLTNKG